MSVFRGGKTVYGASVGILMLETRFPRIPGDMGNALSWPFPVHYRVVRGATPNRVVLQDARELTSEFIDAARELVAMGADGITTNCGFLALVQDELASATGVPVASSSLMQVPFVQSILPPGKRVGILTISKSSLSEAHLTSSGVPLDTPIVGTNPKGAFATGILNDQESLNFADCRADNLSAASELCAQNPDVGAIVLECTNMVPYAADIRQITGLPVFSIHSFISWFQAGLMPRRFESVLDDGRTK